MDVLQAIAALAAEEPVEFLDFDGRWKPLEFQDGRMFTWREVKRFVLEAEFRIAGDRANHDNHQI